MKFFLPRSWSRFIFEILWRGRYSAKRDKLIQSCKGDYERNSVIENFILLCNVDEFIVQKESPFHCVGVYFLGSKIASSGQINRCNNACTGHK